MNAKQLMWFGSSIWFAGVVLGIFAGPAVGHWANALGFGAIFAVAGIVTPLH